MINYRFDVMNNIGGAENLVLSCNLIEILFVSLIVFHCSLSQNNIGVEGVVAIAAALKVNKTITTIE